MQLEPMELAGCTLDRYISTDNSRPSFLEITGISTQRSPTCSGLNAGDYRNLTALLNHPTLWQLKILNKVPLPPEIMEHFSHMQCHCLKGVFPEINRVWLAIDNNIYVWAFEHVSDVACYNGLGETIVSVGLVKPKPDEFQDFVKFLLILTTTVEIVAIGVTFSSSKNDGSGELEEIRLIPEPAFVLPTDGVAMMSVKSTAKGRIFLGGKDGCLYEITYQAQPGWFRKHCKKINHSTSVLSFLVPTFLNAALYDEDPIVKIEVDNSRHILYTLSEKGCIEVFDLGEDGEGISKVVRLTQSKIVSSAVHIVKTLDATNFKPVVAISAVEESESEHLNLVAVTQTGARLYFSAGSGDVNEDSLHRQQRPQYLYLMHVRLPPGFTPDGSVLKPKQVHSAVYENGCLVMVCSEGSAGEAETLWCLSRAEPAAAFSEACTLLALDAPVWAVTALPPQYTAHLSAAMLSKKEVWREPRWAVVTPAGAGVVSARAPPDLLRQLLREFRGPDADPVRDFFQLHSLDEACACAAYLACEDTQTADLAVSEWATRALFLYGGQLRPALTVHQLGQPPSSILSPNFLPRHMSTPMSIRGLQMQQEKFNHSYQGQMYQSFPGSPIQSFAPQTWYHQNMMSPPPFNQSLFGNATRQREAAVQAEFSARHNGIYIYVGRILAPLWNLKCVLMSKAPGNKEFMSSKVTGEDCAFVVQKLQRVAGFLQRTQVSPQTDEHVSLQALKMFVMISIEMLSFWKVMCEHQFHDIAASLPPGQQNALQAASFGELLVGGQEVACLLLGSLVAGYLKDNASVDGISQKLHQLCPTLYRQEDAICSKANELLIFAKQEKNVEERDQMLHHALKLCKDVAPHVNLPAVCSKLVSAGFYSGVVELCVAYAAKLDSRDEALLFYTTDQLSQDRKGQGAYLRRMEIYREVCTALERVYEKSNGTLTNEPSPVRSEPPNDSLTLSPAVANYQGKKLVWECLSQPDELLHVAVYEWLVSKNLAAELLSLGTAPPKSLRRYLGVAARAVHPPAAVLLLDLLWKVLEQCGDHVAAAEVLEGLATRPGSGATLCQRMSWLCAGVVCLRGAGAGGAGNGELLRALEEASEVARVQLAVRAAAAALPRHLQPASPALQRLNNELLDITQLYEEYADRYNLWECKLAIVQCSRHVDGLLVENIWSNILSEAEAAARGLLSPDEQLMSVLSKLTSLGREYVNTRHCFPLYFIVRQLEISSCKLQAEKSLVFRTVLNIGVTLEQVLDIYVKLVSINERVWLGCGDEKHVCAVAALILEAARNELRSLADALRRKALARCKELHEAALSSLQSRPNTQLLIGRLSVAQAHLDRMD